MYKKIFISLALVAGLSSCNGDYTDWVLPEENTQQEVKEVAIQFTPVTDLIDLDKVEGNEVKIGDFTSANVQKITDAFYNVKAGDRTYAVPVSENGIVINLGLGVSPQCPQSVFVLRHTHPPTPCF